MEEHEVSENYSQMRDVIGPTRQMFVEVLGFVDSFHSKLPAIQQSIVSLRSQNIRYIPAFIETKHMLENATPSKTKYREPSPRPRLDSIIESSRSILDYCKETNLEYLTVKHNFESVIRCLANLWKDSCTLDVELGSLESDDTIKLGNFIGEIARANEKEWKIVAPPDIFALLWESLQS